jgi:hypothetical protein
LSKTTSLPLNKEAKRGFAPLKKKFPFPLSRGRG